MIFDGLFGTDGIRGVAGTWPIDGDGAYRFGRAVAAAMAAGGGEVPLGRDTRDSGPELADAIARGLRDGGCDVLDLGVVPTPALAWFVALLDAPAGIAVSASHNPPEQNGFKLFGPRGEKTSRAVEQRVEHLLQADLTRPTAPGAYRYRLDAAAAYVEFALATVPDGVDLRGVRVAVDAAHGATCGTTPAALAALGAEVVCLGCDGLGESINVDCGSLHPAALQRFAADHGAAIGVAHDGDGDRLVMVDERQQIVCGDRILGITAAALRSRGELNGGGVVGTVVSNYGLERWLREQGLPFHRSDVGDRNVWDLMCRCGAELGGEPSGHTILRRLARTDDALLTALQVLSAVALSGRPLSELAGGIPLVPQVSRDVKIRAKPPLDELPTVGLAVAEARRRLDGDGRLVVRYSGTEPVARILAEGPDRGLLDGLVSLVANSFHTAGIGF